MDLEVGPGEPAAGPEEATGLDDVGGQRAAALVAQERYILLGQCFDERLGVGQEHQSDRRVVLQVLADRQVYPRHDPVRLELVGDPDPGQHQDLRGVVGAGAQDHLALGAQLRQHVGALELHADGALAVEQDPRAQRVGDHGQVGALHGGMQVGHRGAAAHPGTLGELVVTHTALLRPVEVVGAPVPGLFGPVR